MSDDLAKPNFKHLSLIIGLAIAIAVGLLVIRWLSVGFVLGTDTFEHPYIEFVVALMGAGLFWLGLVACFRRYGLPSETVFFILFGIGLFGRIIFLGSTPIYEDDWNRYLWDGMVTAEGYNPYEYPPDVFLRVSPQAPQDIRDLQALSAGPGQGITTRINNPWLTTIYPPIAMAVFTVSSVIVPANLDALRILYLVIDGIGLFLLIKALQAFGRHPYWSLLYWLNPLIIYSVYNVAHMDIIMFPFLMASLVVIKTRPYWSAIFIGLAGAVKFWPLLLAPVLLRHYRSRPLIYVTAGALSGLVCLVLVLPMLLSLHENSGLVAYSNSWVRSSFIYPYLNSLLSVFGEQAARIVIAVFLAGLSFYLSLKPRIDVENVPALLMCLSLCLYLISPTGYPWYLLWVMPFFAFLPLYGLGLLTLMVGLYYVRYALAEREIYDVYTNILVPIQFGIPMIVLGFEAFYHRRKLKV